MESIENINDEICSITQGAYILLNSHNLSAIRCRIIDKYGDRVLLEILKEPVIRTKGLEDGGVISSPRSCSR